MKSRSWKPLLPTFRITSGVVTGSVLWLALAAAGLIGLYHRIASGHALAGYGSYIPWGIWVALYFYGAGIAAGVFVTGGLGYLAGVKGLASPAGLRATVVLSLAALLPGLLAIGLDLGRFDRAVNLFLHPNFTSVLTLNTMLYSMFVLAAVAAWLLTWQKTNAWLKPLVLFGAVLCTAFAMGSGAFFAAVSVKPFWDSALWPVVTLVSGLTGGAAVLMLTRGLLSDVDAEHDAGCRLARHVVQAGLVLYLLLAGIKWMTGHVYDAPGMPAPQTPTLPVLSSVWFQLGAGCRLARHVVQAGLVLYLLLAGIKWVTGHVYDVPGMPAAQTLALPVLSSLWFQLGVGCILSLILLIAGGKRLRIVGALIAASTLLGGRMDLVLKGQPAEMPLLPEAFQHSRLVFDYRVTAMEWQITALLLAIAAAIYTVGLVVNRTVETTLHAQSSGRIV